jgi:catechol 2,3-dioxygenase-like lactoylglutathione lyase family enzyme
MTDKPRRHGATEKKKTPRIHERHENIFDVVSDESPRVSSWHSCFSWRPFGVFSVPQCLRGLSAVMFLAALQSWTFAQGSGVGFHHVHLNSTDPAKAIAWYLKTFAVTSKATVGGYDGVASEKMFVLVSRVPVTPSTALDSAIWHFGWGSPDMPADFAMHQANGVQFATPLSKLASGTVFAYLKAPDGGLVEINSATSRAFVHVHLTAEHPLCAADWYVQHLGALTRTAPRSGPCEAPYAAPSEPLAVIRSPAATVRFDEISLIIYPRQRPGPVVSSTGHVVDHIALSVTDLAATLKRLEGEGVRVLRSSQAFGSGGKSAFIEGPDAIVIELVERP